MNKKKPYIFKKSDAIRMADPIARFYAEDDERILAELIEESEPLQKEHLKINIDFHTF